MTDVHIADRDVLLGKRMHAWLSRVCDDRTMTRVVDPVLADYQHEAAVVAPRSSRWKAGALRARWTTALAKALVFDTLLRPRRAGDRRSDSQVVAWTLMGCGAIVALQLTAFMPQVMSASARTERPWLVAELLSMLLPSALVVGIPVGVLMGALARVRRHAGPSKRARVVPAVAAAAVTLVLTVWAVPAANQCYQRAMYASFPGGSAANAGPVRGPNELPMRELSAGAVVYRLRDMPAHAAEYRFAAQVRLALPAACLVFGWLGAALTRTPAARTTLRRVALTVIVVMTYYIVLMWGRSSARALDVSPIVAVWLPNAVCALAAVCCTAWSRVVIRRSAAA